MRSDPPFPFSWLMGALITLLVGATFWRSQLDGQPSFAATSADTPRLSTSRTGVPVWTPQFIGGQEDVTREQAIEAARDFDLIAALKGTYREFVPEMKAANPALTLLVYVNGAFAHKNQGSTYPEDWYAHDDQGNKIRSEGFGSYMMDISHPEWIEAVAKRCEEFIAFSRYDGCLLDVLGTGPLARGYATATPINPATGEAWEREDWFDATLNIAEGTKRRVAPRLVIGNGLRNGPRYFEEQLGTAPLVDTLDGGMAEIWLRGAPDDLDRFAPEENWRQDIDLLVDASKRGKWLLVTTKVWAEGDRAQKDRWHRYALGSFLLGKGKLSLFSFLYDRSFADSFRYHSIWDVRLGRAKGPYYKEDGAYQRDFSRGKALVNPTANTVTVRLPRPFVALAGNRVRSVTLGPHEAEILQREAIGAAV